MSTEGNPPNTEGTATTNANGSATAAASGAVAPLSYKFAATDNVPSWAQGKTVEEVLTLSKQMAETIQGLAPPAAAVAQTQPVAQGAQQPGLPTDDDFIRAPRESTERFFKAQSDAFLAPQITGLMQQNAASARALATQMYADDFKRWGPEIDSVMVAAPLSQRNLDSYEKVVTFIRGKHQSEVLAEQKQKWSAEAGALGERSGGSPAGGVSGVQKAFDPEKLQETVRTAAQRHGLTEQDVREFCAKTGTSIEKWVEMANDNKLVTSQSPFQFQLTEASLGIGRQFAD